MKRRTLVVAVGATVASAGCLADEAENPVDDRTADAGNTDDQTEGPAETDRIDGAVVSHFDGDPTRPECERESETIVRTVDGEPREYESEGTVPYPDPPDEFDRDDIVDYVEAFEHAYVSHAVLCSRSGSGRVLDVGYSVRRTETFDWDDDVTVVFLLRVGGAVSGIDGDGRLWEAELAAEGVVYAVDESGVARAEFPESGALERDAVESHAPNPLDDGELVVAFD